MKGSGTIADINYQLTAEQFYAEAKEFRDI